MTPDQPIGIFDSGLGGLTVAAAVRKLLPNEKIVYLGDTARVPYGNRSPETIRTFAEQDIAFLISKNVKAIVAACNTVSATALSYLQKKFPDLHISGVIEPGADAAAIDLKKYLTDNNLLAPADSHGSLQLYASDIASGFREQAARFLGTDVPEPGKVTLTD